MTMTIIITGTSGNRSKSSLTPPFSYYKIKFRQFVFFFFRSDVFLGKSETLHNLLN